MVKKKHNDRTQQQNISLQVIVVVLLLCYCLIIIINAIETSGVYGPRTADFLKELGHRLRQCRELSIILPKGCRLPFREAIQLQ